VCRLTPARATSLPSLSALDAALQTLSEALNAELVARQHMRLGGRHDCQLSYFPGNGAGFKKHADTKEIRGRGRKLTIILYLNPTDWAAGGALRIYGAAGLGGGATSAGAVTTTDIAPYGDTVVVLRSDVQVRYY